MTDKYKALRSFTTGKVPRIHWLSKEGDPCAVPLVEVQQELKALIAERDSLVAEIQISDEEILTIAHCKATRYTHEVAPGEVTYGFSVAHLLDFARAVLEKARTNGTP